MSRSGDSADRIIDTTLELTRIIRQRMTADSKEKGANMLQVHSLLLIGEKPDMTMKEFADCLHIASPSATSIVNRLVRLRWVGRRHDARNRKLVRLRLTQAGRTKLSVTLRKRTEILRGLFGLLSSAEQSALADLHEALLQRHSRSHS